MAEFAMRYAHAFAEVAEAAGLDAGAARSQLNDFADTLAGSFELREFLGNPSVGAPQKLKVVDAIAARLGISPKVRNFVAVILEHHRLDSLDEILVAYGEVVDEHSGSAEATITSARPLTDENKALLEAQVSKMVGAQVRATYAEDTALLGGAVVQIGSTIYDGSLRAQLQQLKQTLLNA